MKYFNLHILFIKILLFTLVGFSLQAQTITVKGVVQDSAQQPLVSANIIAVSKTQKGLKFAITDEQGRYQLHLPKNNTYTITTSYIGYFKQEVVYKSVKDTLINFTLQENHEQLNEVVLVQPVVVKQDTIIYNADSFTNGKERKLKQVLQKLPGVEVDRAGNVTVNGKKVKKFLVEGKRFFTGDPKLGVNNIPANAIDKVEVLDNHSDIAFLKGLEDSEDMAMNIKLKKDKKQFVFGDIEASAGVADSENYLLHPALFYYSPKTKVNIIGDLNNLGKKSFTVKDYINFEGGFSKLAQDASAYFKLYRSDFAQFLNAQNFKTSTHKFGAFNITQTLTKKTELSAYTILSNSKNETQINTQNQYNYTATPLLENRTQTGNTNNTFGLGKLSLNYSANSKTEFYANTFIKLSNNTALNNINTISSNSQNIKSSRNNISSTLKQNFEWHKQRNAKHTFSVLANYEYQKSNPNTNWLTNQQLLSGLLPLQTENTYNINQLKTNNSHQINTIAKHYWVLNRFNHIYTTLGSVYVNQNFTTQEYQLVANNTHNNFNSAGFGNDNQYLFNDSYLGVHYKLKKGIVIIKPGLFWHQFSWNANKNLLNAQYKSYLLPELTTNIEIKKSEKITIKYNLVPQFATPNQLASNFTLTNFNSVYQGNNQLSNSLTHQASATYYKFNLYRGIFINGGIYYRNKVKNIQNTLQQTGIDAINTAIQTTNPEKSLTAYGRFSKSINTFKFTLDSRYSLSKNTQLVNNQVLNNQSKNTSVGLSVKTLFDAKYPKITLKQEHSFSNFKSANTTSQFINKETNIELDYTFLKDFVLTADYTYTDYRNKQETTKNHYTLANTTLFYQKEDSAWGYELSATNIFDVQYKKENSFSEIVISDSQTYVLPRIISFKISYKL